MFQLNKLMDIAQILMLWNANYRYVPKSFSTVLVLCEVAESHYQIFNSDLEQVPLPETICHQ